MANNRMFASKLFLTMLGALTLNMEGIVMNTDEVRQLVEALDNMRVQQVYSDITSTLQNKLDQISTRTNDLESADTDLIATAFAAAQLEYPSYIGPNRDGKFLKSQYTDIPGLRRAIMPILAKHGLAFRQSTDRRVDGTLILISTLSHSSGQFYSSKETITPENGTQRAYNTEKKNIRRQQMMALLQCDPFMDADDDDGEGEAESNNQVPLYKKALHDDVDLSKHSYMTITPEQIDQIETELDGWPDLAKSFFKAFEIKRVADLRRSQYDTAFKDLLRIKAEMKRDKL